MDIKELDKKQLVLLTLLITFVVSIATGIVTVSLMNQMPKSVPQTINNVIQRTIEKVTTVQVPAPAPVSGTKDSTVGDIVESKNNGLSLIGNSDALVSIYLNDTKISDSTVSNPLDTTVSDTAKAESTAIGQGIIISDIGLVLVDSILIKDSESYKVVLDKTDFNVSVLKKYDNGFTVLKISPITLTVPTTPDTTDMVQ
jgi:hypothetical protein